MNLVVLTVTMIAPLSAQEKCGRQRKVIKRVKEQALNLSEDFWLKGFKNLINILTRRYGGHKMYIIFKEK